MERKAIFPGSFDPFHEGHEFIVKKALEKFDFLYIVISWSESKKQRYQSFDKSYKEIFLKYQNYPNIEVLVNDNLLTSEVAKILKCNYIVRGWRDFRDIEYENKLRKIILEQNPNLKFIYFQNRDKISSSTLKKKTNML